MTDLLTWLTTTSPYWHPLPDKLGSQLLRSALNSGEDAMIRSILASNLQTLFNKFEAETFHKVYLKVEATSIPQPRFRIHPKLRFGMGTEVSFYPTTRTFPLKIKSMGSVMITVPTTLQAQTVTLNHRKQSITLTIQHLILPPEPVVSVRGALEKSPPDYISLLKHLVDPKFCPSEEILWLLRVYGEAYNLTSNVRAQILLEYLVSHNFTNRDYFENLILAVQGCRDPTLLNLLVPRLIGYLNRYELLGPWESGAINAIFRLLTLITSEAIIADAIRDNFQFNYQRFTMNEEEDVVPSDASDCAALTKATRNIMESILQNKYLYQAEMSPYLNIISIAVHHYYTMLSQDLLQKFQTELHLSNELLDLYAELETLHRFLYREGFTEMKVLSLYPIFKPYLIQYILTVESKLQEWNRGHLQLELTVEDPTHLSSTHVFKTLAHSKQMLARFKHYQCRDEYVLFVAMMGRVIQDYLEQLLATRNPRIMIENRFSLQKQLEVFISDGMMEDPRVEDLVQDIRISIQRAWDPIRLIIVEDFSGLICQNPTLKVLDQLDTEISVLSSALEENIFLEILEAIFERIITNWERMLLPTANPKATRQDRLQLMPVLQAILPPLMNLFHSDGVGIPLAKITSICARIQEAFRVYTVNKVELARLYHHPTLLTPEEIFAVLIIQLQKRKATRRYLRRMAH